MLRKTMGASPSRWLMGVGILLLAAIFTACGGDAGTAGSGDLTNIGGEPLAATERQQTLDSAATQMSALVNSGATSRQADPEQIAQWMEQFAAFLRQDPRLTNVTINTELQTVTAIFTDGVPYAAVFNRLFPEPAEDDPTLEELEGEDAGRAVNGIPQGTQAVLVNCLGSAFKGDHARIQTALENGGYNVTNIRGTLDNLYNLNLSPAILYYEAHGAQGAFVDAETNMLRPAYSVWTDTKVDVDDGRYPFYVEESAQRQKLVMVLASADIVNGEAVMENRWGLAPNFIRNHFNFVPDALFFNDCCYGQHAVAATFRAAAFSAGAGLYAGWTNPADNKNQALYFFDLVAGANSYVHGNPDYRPFSYPDVYARMQQVRLTTFASSYGPSLLTFTPTTTQTDSTEAFRPTIQGLEVVTDSNGALAEDLILLGTFGRDPNTVGYEGHVTISGAELNVVDWQHNRIRCDLPSEGTAAAGFVKVMTGDLESNEVPLTAWRGTVELNYDPHLTTLHSKLVLDVLFRGDIHRYRTAPRNSTLIAPLNFYSVPRTEAGYAEGTGEHQAMEVHYTGLNGPTLMTPNRATIDALLSASPPSRQIPELENTGFVAGRLDPTTRQVELCIYALGFTQLHGVGPMVDFVTPYPVIAPYAGNYQALYDRGRGIVGCFDLTASDSMVIPGGSRHIQFVDDQGDLLDVDLSWTSLTPSFLPSSSDPA